MLKGLLWMEGQLGEEATSAITTPAPSVASKLEDLAELPNQVQVALSSELVRLLSEQLYQSPLKAIEELVVNSFDADAKECRIAVRNGDLPQFVAIYDDGIGMTADGLGNLWHIGQSNKRTEGIAKQSVRKQIGKFGIGKLATYTIANRLTHISRSGEKILVLQL